MRYILFLVMILISCGSRKTNCDAYGDNRENLKEVNEYEKAI